MYKVGAQGGVTVMRQILLAHEPPRHIEISFQYPPDHQYKKTVLTSLYDKNWTTLTVQELALEQGKNRYPDIYKESQNIEYYVTFIYFFCSN